ncbi:hypothetical protein V9T40_012994 [Parthenolecanium corni]|uniref:Amino acid transporter transmembrane domain-containing protein n=1 Tax=Parthenolecanium corni TaxID=536013 RepID=A0AAN9Y138_9HEMI
MEKVNPNSFMGIFGALSLESRDESSVPQLLTDDSTYKFVSTPTAGVRTASMETVCVQDNPSISADEVIQEPSELPTSRQPSEDNEPYDPHDYCEAEESTSLWDSVNLLVIVGAGPIIFSLPSTFIRAGYLLGSVLMICLILLYAYNMHLVVWTEYEICKIKRVPNMSYPETLYCAFKMGPLWVRPMAPVARCLLCSTQKMIWFGHGHYSYAFICRYLQIAIENFGGARVNEAILSPVLIIPLVLLCWIPNLKYLASFSKIANIANMIAIIIVLYYVLSDPLPWLSLRPFGNYEDVPQFLGAILLSMKTAGILMSIKNQMKRPGEFDGEYGVLMKSYLPIALLYPCFSLICSFKYGSSLEFSVLENLPKQFFTNLAFVLATLAYMLQFPLILYVPFDLIWNHMLKDGKKKIRAPKFWELTLRTVLVLLSYVLSASVSNVTIFVAVCGTIASSIDSFLLPAIMQTLVLWKTCQSKTIFCCILARNTFTLVIGVVLIVSGVFDCFYQIIKYHGQLRNDT